MKRVVAGDHSFKPLALNVSRSTFLGTGLFLCGKFSARFIGQKPHGVVPFLKVGKSLHLSRGLLLHFNGNPAVDFGAGQLLKRCGTHVSVGL